MQLENDTAASVKRRITGRRAGLMMAGTAEFFAPEYLFYDERGDPSENCQFGRPQRVP
jgi:hypothetical protein